MVDVVPVVPVPVVLIGVVVEVRVCARAGPALYSGRAVTKVAAKTVVFKIIVSSAGASPSTNCRRGCSKTTGGAVREGRLPLKQFQGAYTPLSTVAPGIIHRSSRCRLVNSTP